MRFQWCALVFKFKSDVNKFIHNVSYHKVRHVNEELWLCFHVDVGPQSLFDFLHR